MKTKKRSIGNAEQGTVIVEKGGGSPFVLPLTLLGLGVAGYFIIPKILANHAETVAEGDTSPESQVANQFKSVFGPKDNSNWVVSDSDYQAAALLLTDQNKEKVYTIYKGLTDRNLSDDIAKHISSGVQSKAAKVQSYNSKKGKTFSVTPDNKVAFEIVAGDTITFNPGSTTPVTVYNNPMGVVINDIKDNQYYTKVLAQLKSNPKTVPITVSTQVTPSKKTFKVIATKTIPWSGIQASAAEFEKIIRPYVKTQKTYAVIQILAGTQAKTNKPVYAWVDARDFTLAKKGVKGIGTASLIM